MATSSAGLTSEQQAIFRELQSRRNSLAPEQQSIVDELGRRLGLNGSAGADTMPEFHAAPPPSGGFWSSLVNAVNPIPSLLDYIQHGPPAKQGIQALSHMDPSELPMPAGYSPDLLQQAGAPGVTAAGQAGEGNIAGAAGTLAGGYGLPLAAGKLAPEEGGTFSRILDLRKNPEFQRAAINLLPKGKEINMVRDMLTGTPPAPKVIPPPPLGRVINPVQNTPINPDLLTPPRVEFPEQSSPRVVAPPPIGRTINPVVEPKPAQVVPPPGVTFKPLPIRTVPQAPAPVFRTPSAIPSVESSPGAAAQPGSSLAQPGGIQPIQASTTNAPFTVTPGEGTHLGLEVKPGQIPAKADYQAAARNTWASHIARDLQRRNVSLDAFNAMTDTELDALAKELGLNPSSAAKRSIVVKKLSGK